MLQQECWVIVIENSAICTNWSSNDDDAEICLNLSVEKCLIDIRLLHLCFQSLLDEPNPNSPANNLAAQLYQENRREYEKKVRAIVEESWINC